MLLVVAAVVTESHAQAGMKYPYVQNGTIIVSRDGLGGVKPEYLRPSNTARPDVHGPADTYNLPPAKFEVAGADEPTAMTWSKTMCDHHGEGWRTPTQRELMLMYLLNDKLVPKMKAGHYWSDTLGAAYDAYWGVVFLGSDLAKVDSYSSDTADFYVRCVRTVE